MKKLSRFVLIAALFGMVSCGASVLRADARKEIESKIGKKVVDSTNYKNLADVDNKYLQN